MSLGYILVTVAYLGTVVVIAFAIMTHTIGHSVPDTDFILRCRCKEHDTSTLAGINLQERVGLQGR
jgi:hypothetical protein